MRACNGLDEKKWIKKRITLCLSIREAFDWMTMMFQQWRSYLSFHVLWMKHINLMFSVSFICRQILIKLQLRLCYLFNFFFKKLCLSILEKTIIRYNTVSDFMGGCPASPLTVKIKLNHTHSGEKMNNLWVFIINFLETLVIT